ncbi:MAG: fibronectin type III domain-containing protein, partial [Elusimicrobia bacterium]|nr:fibronectin type III domain-containing protein [Elusimicrobiota bacterium]
LGAAAALTADGQVTIFGGDSGVGEEASAETAYFTEAPDTLSLGVAAGARKPVLSSVDVQPFQGANYTAIPSGNGPFVTIKGSGFLGVGDGSGGGAASGNSSFNGPRLLLQSLGGSGGSGGQAGSAFTLELTTRVYSKGTDAPADPNLWTVADSSISLKLPTGGIIPNPGLGGNMLPYGWYQLRAYSNAVYSDALLVQAGPPKPAAAPGAVSVAAIGVSSISWSWSQASLANGSFDGYEIFSATSGIVIATAATNVVSFAQTNLAPNTTGSILVAAYTLSGDGPLSRSATYYTLCSTPIVSGAQAPAVFSDVAANSLTLSWNAHGNSPGTIYEVSQSRDNFAQDVSTPVPALVNLATTTVTISQLLPATRYYFRVRAVNGAQVASDFSDVVSTTTGAPITGLAGSAVDAATIQWNWVDPGGVTHFNIYNSTTGAVIATTKAATYRDAGLAANSERSIMVSAVTAGGEGPLSAGATAYTLANPPGVLDPALSGISTGSVTAAWSANGNPLGTVYELVIDDAGGAQLSTMTTTGFTAGYGALPQAAADFDVKAAALNGDGVASAFVTLGSTATLAQAPSGLQVTSTTPSSIAVSWDDGNNSSSTTYEVTYSSDNFLTTQTAISFAQKEKDLTSATIPDLLTSSTYSIRVQAVNPFGLLSPFSNLVTTAPFNGGAPLGSLGIEVTHAQPTLISGSIGTGRLITLRIPADTFSTDTHLLVSTRAVAAGSPCGGGLAVGLSITPDPPLQPL